MSCSYFVAPGGGRRRRPVPRLRLPQLGREHARLDGCGARAENKLCEAAICYTGDILDPARAKYDLKYYVALAQGAGAGRRAYHRRQGHGGAAEAGGGARAVQGAARGDRPADPFPHARHVGPVGGDGAGGGRKRRRCDRRGDGCAFGQHLAALPRLARRGAEAAPSAIPGLDPEWIRRISFYWEAVRNQYAAFESDLKGPASEVYLHEMPGGQFTNLKEQARSLGLETRWHEVAQAYHDVNLMFGDIVKVTPSSKVVGDMALMMVSQDLTVADVENPAKDIAFPDSVVSMLRGDLGQPPGGWPEALQKKALKGDKPITVRPGSLLEDRRPAGAARRARGKAGAQGQRVRVRLVADVPEGVLRLRRRAGELRPGQRAADAGLFLRHAAGGRDLRRHRARQDAGDPLPGDRRQPTRRAWSRCSSSSTASRGASRCPTAAAATPPRSCGARRSRATRRMSARRCRAWSRPSPWQPASRSRPATCCCRSRR